MQCFQLALTFVWGEGCVVLSNGGRYNTWDNPKKGPPGGRKKTNLVSSKKKFEARRQMRNKRHRHFAFEGKEGRGSINGMKAIEKKIRGLTNGVDDEASGLRGSLRTTRIPRSGQGKDHYLRT